MVNDDDANDTNGTSFSGGQIIMGTPQIIDGDAFLIAHSGPMEPHPWNAATNHPRPAPAPSAPPKFQLTVKHLSVRSGEDFAVARALCGDMEQLLELNAQFEALGYHFVCLERLPLD